MLVSIVILNINGENILKRCLESIRKLQFKNYEVIVVDNGSSDDSCRMIRNNFPEVRLFEIGRNLGYGGGNNYGAKVSKGDLILFLNNDVIMTAESLGEIVLATKRNPGSGILGCKVFYCDDNKTLQHTGGVLHKSGSGFMRGQFEYDHGQYDNEEIVDWVIGAAMMVKREVFFKINGFDEIYHPIYHDEIDVSQAARVIGYDTVYVPKSVIYHCEDVQRKSADYKRVFLRYRNKTIFLIKFFGIKGAIFRSLYDFQYLLLRNKKYQMNVMPKSSTSATVRSMLQTVIWVLRKLPMIYSRTMLWYKKKENDEE